MRSDTFTQLLQSWSQGSAEAPQRLFPLVYDELRGLAHRQLWASPRDQTLRTTALVHEAFVKLAGHSELSLQDRGHFLALAARAMRQILVDHARRRTAGKRGGPRPTALLDAAEVPVAARAGELVALDTALARLEEVDEGLARVVELRFFGGLSVEEAAEVLGVSATTVKRDWRRARAFLYRELAVE